MQKVIVGGEIKYRVQVRNPDGSRKSVRFDRKEDAQQFVAKRQIIRQQTRNGLAKPIEQKLFYDYAQVWLKKRMLTKPRSTWAPEESKLRRVWLPKLAKRLMCGIEKIEVVDILDELLLAGASPATRNRYFALIHKMFEDAITDGKLGYNPAARIPLLCEKVKTRKIDYWKTQEEAEKYLASAHKVDPCYGVLCEILLWGGPRIGEALGLAKEAVDFRANTITIKTIVEVNTNKVFDRTKGQGEGGEYYLPLFPRLRGVLEHWFGREPNTEASAPILRSDRCQAGRLTYTVARKCHQKALSLSGVKRITFHDMRRTYASNAQKFGFHKGEIQEMLGHASIKTTETYTKMDMSHLVERGSKLGFGASEFVPVLPPEPQVGGNVVAFRRRRG